MEFKKCDNERFYEVTSVCPKLVPEPLTVERVRNAMIKKYSHDHDFIVCGHGATGINDYSGECEIDFINDAALRLWVEQVERKV